MSDENKVPKLGDWVRQRIFQRFGIQGLVGLALVAAVFFVWTQWGTVKTWGSVLRHGNETKPDLYLTAGGGEVEKSKQYTLEISTEFRLPKVFWGDLSDILRLVITTQDTQFRAKKGHYLADRLQPFIERVKNLLKASANRADWDANALGSTRVILADDLMTLGDQSGENEPIEEAVAVYREALKERTRDRVPLDWAKTQNNLGNALSRLGERESGTERLAEAVFVYREALIIFEAAEATYYISLTKNNLEYAQALLVERRRS